jgi:hypothetical protein
MPESSFIGYVGEADFHDGSILAVEEEQNTVRVQVRGASGKTFRVEFSQVCAVKSNRPVGMLLYALSEMSCQPPIRRFVFANWDDQSNAHLEVDAVGFAIREE